MAPRNLFVIGIVVVVAIVGVVLAITMVKEKSSIAAKQEAAQARQSTPSPAPTPAPSTGDFSSSSQPIASNTSSFGAFDETPVHFFSSSVSSSLGSGFTSGSSGSASATASASTEEEEDQEDDSEGEDAEEKGAPLTSEGNSTDEFSLHLLAIGDWGVSPAGDSCCNKYRKTDEQSEAYFKDQQAQSNVAYLMSLSAEKLHPSAILGHGDNFYWNGLGTDSAAYRLENTFEGIYNQPSLQGIKWLNVMGNHDYGGSSYICGTEEDKWFPCETIEEMEAGLDAKFDLQSQYTSPNDNRWQMPGHYYKETLTDAKQNLTVDIYNVDTNAAAVHGAEQVCCQCYGYQNDLEEKNPLKQVKCNSVHRGHELCFGGNLQFYDKCFEKFQKWTQDSLTNLQKDTVHSKADWKIVNSHFSPHFHMERQMMKEWFHTLQEGQVQLFINGHTHGESHDFAQDLKTHFITNGAGGGIQSESIGKPPPDVTNIENVWLASNAPYGFVELSFGKKKMQSRFVTFDHNWHFDSKQEDTKKGNRKIDHCWEIPIDGSLGKTC